MGSGALFNYSDTRRKKYIVSQDWTGIITEAMINGELSFVYDVDCPTSSFLSMPQDDILSYRCQTAKCFKSFNFSTLW